MNPEISQCCETPGWGKLEMMLFDRAFGTSYGRMFQHRPMSVVWIWFKQMFAESSQWSLWVSRYKFYRSSTTTQR